MAWQFMVVDGADAGRTFLLPDEGTALVGTSHKHCDVCVHDLYVARVHCQLDVAPDGGVTVTDQHPAGGTFVNQERVTTQALKEGDVLRIGNTHLKLQVAEPDIVDPDVIEEEEEIAVDTVDVVEDQPGGPAPYVPAEQLGDLVGYTVGHFLLEELLGRSPYKAVFRATDQKTGQVVSLKVLSPTFPATPEELAHFVPVIKRALPLRHEHLVTLFGSGKSSYYVWLAREFVEGKCLVEVLEKLQHGTKPKWRTGLRLARELASVLGFIHGHQVLHGRVSPYNILIRNEDKSAKLANLMLEQALATSQLRQAARAANQAQDAPYQAPEFGQPGVRADVRMDLYSLGAVVYARVTGKPPGPGCPPPRKLNPEIPAEFEAILLKLLNPKPEGRFPNAAAVSAALEQFAGSLQTAE